MFKESNKMRIGVYTFFRNNYGAVLQAYSLQKTIKDLCPGDEVLMVDFRTEYHKSLERVFRRRSPNPLYNFIWQVHALLRYNQLKKKCDSFREFKNQFDYSDCYSSQSELLNNPPLLDIHLSGSDQVFNPKREYRDVYYLKFKKGNSRKMAYSPSFGINEFSDDDTQYIKRMLSDFDFLSCRETEGALFMSSLLGKDIPQVMDPVFLTTAEQWRSIEKKPMFNGHYVFVYSLKDTRRVLRFAKKNYPDATLVLLSPNDLRFYSGCKHIYYPGPSDYLGLIDNADAVVTDSFHGTAFSVIFGKEFKTIITRQDVSIRIKTLLSLLGLEKNIVSEGTAVPDSKIEYKDKLKQLITDSLAYLNASLHSDPIR